MRESRRCPQCNTEIPANSPIGLCPRCLLKPNNDSQSAAEPGPTKLTPPVSGFVPPTVEELAPLFPQMEILELLGKGGMGAVYKARQPGLDRLVAVKILPPEISHEPAFTERFQREARALARLSHPHIVAVYDFGETAGLCYIVMEFVDGANLRQAIQTKTLTSAEALAIVPQICEALQFAHDEGIVHRDIKPENILIDKRGRVKIADFGLAKLLGQDASDHSLTATHQVMGTLRYMAPEQMQGSRAVDHRADIYSLGVVFYELLTGELPMGRFAPPSKRVQVDVRLDEIVLRALEQQPEHRYQHASEVKTDLANVTGKPQFAPVASLAPQSVPVAPPPPSPTNLADQKLVEAPGKSLVISGILLGASGLIVLLVFVVQINTGILPLGAATDNRVAVPLQVLFLSHWGIGILAIVAGILMRRLRCHSLALTAAGLCIASPLPLFFLVSINIWTAMIAPLLTFATGIWTLVVLRNPAVKVAFVRENERRRAWQRVKPLTANLQEQIKTRGTEVLIAGIALLLGGFISFAIAASWDVWHRDKFAALGLAGAGTLHFLVGIAAINGGLFLSKMRFIGFSFVAAWMLCVMPCTIFLTNFTLLKFSVVPLAFALYAGIRAVSVLLKPETKAAFAAVRAQSSDEADESRWSALSLAVGLTGGLAAGVAMFWGFSATGMGPGLPWRFDILVWLPGAVAAFGAAVLLIKSSSSGRTSAADTIPEMVLAALGISVGALPWRGLDHPVPNPWSNLVGSAWESSQGVQFSLTYLALGLFLLVTGGRKTRPAWRAAVTLLAGVTSLVLTLHFATHPSQPAPDGFWHMPDGTLIISQTFQLCFIATFVISLLTVVVGAMQLRSQSNAEDQARTAASSIEATSEPRLSRLALWGAIWAPLTLLGWPSWQWCVRRYFDDPKLFASFDAGYATLGVIAFIVAATAGLGSTLLGGIAVAQIKRSAGKLYGLPLAAIVLLAHPLIAVFVGIALPVSLALHSLLPLQLAAVAVPSSMLALAVCFVIGFAVWRKVIPDSTRVAITLREKLRLAGIALLIAGIMDALSGLVWIGHNVSVLEELLKQGEPIGWQVASTCLSVGSLWIVYYVVGVALHLMTLEDDGDFTFCLLTAAIVPPGCLIGLPVAIYAMVQLSKSEVKALIPVKQLDSVAMSSADKHETVPSPWEVTVQTWWLARSNLSCKVLWIALNCLCAFCIFGFLSFKGFSDTDHHTHFQIGFLDPWFVFESNQSPGKRSVSGIFWAWSWLFGIGAYGSGWLLFKLKRAPDKSLLQSRSIKQDGSVAGHPEAQTQNESERRHIRWLFAAVLLVIAWRGVGLRQPNSSPSASRVSAAVPPLGTITSGIGAEFTVPAGQVAVFEIVTRRDNETVPVPPHCGYVMAPPDSPVAGTFRWSRKPEEDIAVGRSRKWSLEILTGGGGRGYSETILLPDELNAAVGARGLSLGLLEPNEEAVHWGTDVNDLPANGLIGLRVTVVAHGMKTGGSGNANIDWKKAQSAQSTTRRKLHSVAP